MQGKYNLRQDITLESLLVLFIFCKPTDSFDVGGDSWVLMLANFGEPLCCLLLAILATYSGNEIWRKKADLHHGGGNT